MPSNKTMDKKSHCVQKQWWFNDCTNNISLLFPFVSLSGWIIGYIDRCRNYNQGDHPHRYCSAFSLCSALCSIVRAGTYCDKSQNTTKDTLCRFLKSLRYLQFRRDYKTSFPMIPIFYKMKSYFWRYDKKLVYFSYYVPYILQAILLNISKQVWPT